MGSGSHRVGLGHDLHRLEPGGALVLGGVLIDAPVGFVTHSDGDVLCHAIVDAMAGALADGDLGTHFPEDDPEAEDARSLDFVSELNATVRAAGYVVSSLDSFIVLGTVRLRPHLNQMKANIALALGLDPAQVSVKARSNDGIGPEGEGSAASASAVVLLEQLPDHAP
ncbi:2-C-methyl-D-erythritol 2,4-cyclodiphosphate synthase [Microlunatus panaciterrae]|uniref:2-C-methyl-D-erythritol 2,4-cyclodiphosphate synthase n=1 Tax=Microlunatus panaciterrae TaxID=400768 RepID=A0ABS2RGI5_9ACTN|nr:2-C-methyl-D-erythritol 2,4-cyclodiphosphate synthase [Microlunatus panaciterrae]